MHAESELDFLLSRVGNSLFFLGGFPCSVQEVTWVLLLGIHVWDPLGYNRLEQQTRSVSTRSVSPLSQHISQISFLQTPPSSTFTLAGYQV